jgi:hypothetical protein
MVLIGFYESIHLAVESAALTLNLPQNRFGTQVRGRIGRVIPPDHTTLTQSTKLKGASTTLSHFGENAGELAC